MNEEITVPKKPSIIRVILGYIIGFIIVLFVVGIIGTFFKGIIVTILSIALGSVLAKKVYIKITGGTPMKEYHLFKKKKQQ